ncbi:Alpha/Beta hydrolase protein [Mycena metata]|uniref:Alpha/Beta hydrolase protein n=1 Tax=Mycena metata TaxID=1033252 RepID=A0AAD7JTJ5_9AGAR|nr:Alpha/Beta hydrolase protein [Mycena metata]
MSTIPHIDQEVYIVPSFTLECGTELKDAPVAYKTWGRLNDARDNVMVICHALTGSADVEDWWGPLMGRNKAFDPSRFFIFCANTLGSPRTVPAFPPTSIRDDVAIHQHVLRQHLGVQRVAVVIGGSMGGMAALEWPLVAPPNFIKRICVLASAARHSAWCIATGYYDASAQPRSGLAAARMCALLTYRSRDSFERRFGRKAVHLHNDGHRNRTPSVNSVGSEPGTVPGAQPPIFSAQSYLRYQGEKFIARFDANCYIHLTHKMDTHDIARGRWPPASPSPDTGTDPDVPLTHTLALLPPHALIISIQSDGLFTPPEQMLLASHIPHSTFVNIPSGEGHDGFLVEFEGVGEAVRGWLREELGEYYVDVNDADEEGQEAYEVKKESVFGEAEVDFTRW